MNRVIICLIAICAGFTVNAASSLTQLLEKNQASFAPVLPEKLLHGKVHIMDMSKNNAYFQKVDIRSTKALIDFGEAEKQGSGADLLIGRYLEDRNIYRRGSHYGNGEDERTVHLGIDLMAPAGTPIYAPLEGVVHSFKDNNIVADYGPTIILSHRLAGHTFYTLYGHLGRESLTGIKVGQVIQKGAQIATIGKPFENGGWPEHLHFQIITEMQGEKGNYVGVISPRKVNAYTKLCPNPNLILNIGALK
tara:strand:+ start:121 stop:867 length:747 start_codon:yes stop_codon:yes gene_type:complete